MAFTPVSSALTCTSVAGNRINFCTSPMSTPCQNTLPQTLININENVAAQHPYRTHDPRSGSQDHHPSKNSVQKTICCNSTSNAHDDGRMYPKHVAKITLIKLPCCIKLAFQIISSCIYLIIAHLTDRILYC